MYFFNMNEVYGYGKGPEKPELTISSMSLLEFYLKLLNSFLVSQGEMFVQKRNLGCMSVCGHGHMRSHIQANTLNGVTVAPGSCHCPVRS